MIFKCGQAGCVSSAVLFTSVKSFGGYVVRGHKNDMQYTLQVPALLVCNSLQLQV